MKAKELRWLFLLVLIAILVISFLGSPVSFGVSAGWTNSKYEFSGGTSPVMLGLAALLAFLYSLLMFAASTELSAPIPGLLRRYVAFWIDFIFAMLIIGPFLGIIPMIREWRRTGIFAWSFERTTYMAGDGSIAGIGVVLAAAGLSTISLFHWCATGLLPAAVLWAIRFQARIHCP